MNKAGRTLTLPGPIGRWASRFLGLTPPAADQAGVAGLVCDIEICSMQPVRIKSNGHCDGKTLSKVQSLLAHQRAIVAHPAATGDAHLARGDASSARKSYLAALGIFRELASAIPAHTPWQRQLAALHDRIGDAETQLLAALDHYQQALAIRQHVLQTEPGHAEWQRDLSISHERIGNIHFTQGEFRLAMSSYAAMLTIRQHLAQANPEHADWQHDLAVCHEKIGNIHAAQGELAQALQHYRTALGISQQLLARDIYDPQWQHDVSVGHNKVGDILLLQGERAAAHENQLAALDIALKLARHDPDNREWQRGLAVCHVKLGDIAEQPDIAESCYLTALAISENLVATASHGNTEWLCDLAICHERLANALHQQQRIEHEIEHLHHAHAIRSQLAKLDPDHTRWQLALALSTGKLGLSDSQLDAFTRQAMLRQALQDLQKLADKGDLPDAVGQFRETLQQALVQAPAPASPALPASAPAAAGTKPAKPGVPLAQHGESDPGYAPRITSEQA